MTKAADEVVLTLGDPYEHVRQQSRSTLPVATAENAIDLHVTRPAIFRFSDPQFGFVTPPAKFLSLYADQFGSVSLVTLSPQVETLSLDRTMAVVSDLQEQLRRGGWQEIVVSNQPRIVDTPLLRAKLRGCSAPTGYWQAGDRYQLSLNIRCFPSDERPNDRRYLITVDVAAPWLQGNPH